MNRVERIFGDSDSPREFARGYLDLVREVLDALDPDQIAALIEEMLEARERGARIFLIGNGGSAATASHMANDIAIGSRSWERPFRAVSLTDNFAVISALANDYDYDAIFVRQLQTQMEVGDVVLAISVSGNSPNIVEAIEWANANGAVSAGLTGFDGGRLAEIAQIVVHAPTVAGEYGPAEDAHMVIDHLVGAFLIETCARAAATDGR